jgi:hypothetical protein
VKDISFVEKNVDGVETIEGFLKVTASIENTIPAYLTLTAYGVDVSGNAIPSDKLEVTVEKVIAASADGKTPATTEEVIYVRPKDNRVFKTLDGLAFKVHITAKSGAGKTVSGVMLNAYNQVVKVNSLKVQKSGKVAIDLN